MKSRLHDLSKSGVDHVMFAGFSFPKYVWTLPEGDFKKRIERHVSPCTGDYYHAPKPNNKTGIGFYLESDGMPRLRWKRADEVVSLKHTGWYCDDYQDQTIFGIVLILPNKRGFLAGWSMGEGMASNVDLDVYADIESAAYAADSIAEYVAESERESQEENEED